MAGISLRSGALDPPQVREDTDILEGVVSGDDPAVLLAVGTERPVVLPQRHRVDVRPRSARVEGAGRRLLDEVPQLRQLGAQVVVDLDEGLPGRALLRGVRLARPGRRDARSVGGTNGWR